MLLGRLILYVLFGLFLAVFAAIILLLVMRAVSGGMWQGLGTVGIAAATFLLLGAIDRHLARRGAPTPKP